MLKGVQHGTVFGANHHREHLLIRRSASPFSANVQKDGTLVFAVKELVVVPVSLLVEAFIALVEMVDLVIECVGREVSHRHLEHLVGLCSANCAYERLHILLINYN